MFQGNRGLSLNILSRLKNNSKVSHRGLSYSLVLLGFCWLLIAVKVNAEGIVPIDATFEYYSYGYCSVNDSQKGCCTTPNAGFRMSGGVHLNAPRTACLGILNAERAFMQCNGTTASKPNAIWQSPPPYPGCELVTPYSNGSTGRRGTESIITTACPLNSSNVNGKCVCNGGFYAANSSCVPINPKNNGGPSGPSRPHTCQPINISTGNKYLAETDYTGKGPFPLRIARIYNSQANHPGLMGYNWRIDVQSSVTSMSPTTVRVNDADNRALGFTLVNGQWMADADIKEKLTTTQDSAGVITSWTLRYADNSRKIFDWKGRLNTLVTAQGLVQTLVFSDGTSGTNGGYVLDAQGNATEVILPEGLPIRLNAPSSRTLQYGYDAKLRLSKITTSSGSAYRYTYDAANNLISVTYPDGRIKQYRYNESDFRSNTQLPHALTGIIDENGVRIASYHYDNNGRVVQEERGPEADLGIEKNRLSYTTDASGSPSNSTLTGPLGGVSTYSFKNILGTLKSTGQLRAAGSGYDSALDSISYDGRGNITSRIDYKGNITTYQYDPVRNLEISRTESVGTPQARIITTQWHPTLNLPIAVNEQGKTTNYTYHDLAGYLLSKTIQDSSTGQTRTWTYTYTSSAEGVPQRLLKTVDGPRTDVADVTQYSYYPNGDLQSVTNALGHTTQLSNYDAEGNPQIITDANGVVTDLTYTPQGWLASVSTAGNTSSFEHDAVGLITKVTRGDGSWLSYTWDGARRLTKITNNLDETIEYSLDAMGNRTAQRIKDASSSLTQQQTWVYDELGRLLRSVGAVGQTSAQQYDPNDNPTVSTNPKQHSNTKAYDALDRLVANTDPLNGVTALAYDAQDNLTQVQDPRGVTTRYVYDGLGNLTQLISPDSGTTSYSHDAAGNVISKTDANGVVTTYSYDALNRLTGKQYPATPALNVQYHHDMTADGNHGIGRLTAVQDASGVLGYHYDERGNLTEQLRSVAVNGVDQYDSLGYAYDGANQLSRIDYPLGLSIHYPRNAAGQVSQVQLQVGGGQPSGFASNLSYLPFGPLKSLTWANGVSLSRSFDQDYRLTEQSVAGWNSQYGYDANSNIATLNSSLLGELNYNYDALDRLTAEQKASQQQSYSYDAVGNRTGKTVAPIVNGEAQATTTTTYQYASASNRLTQIDSQAVTTDAAGNLTQDRGNRELIYDPQNRLSSVKLDGNTVAEFRYNALGQRTHKISAQGTTTFLYGPDGQLLGETLFSSAGQKLRSQFYIWLDSLPLGGVTVSYDGEGAIASSTPFYLHSDHLNTPRLATDQNQQNVWQWQSDAFGGGQASGSLALNLRFPGQYFDQESGLHYNYFRDYDPQTGRYVESDPIGLKGGLNTYAYVQGNPLALSDPDGLSPKSPRFWCFWCGAPHGGVAGVYCPDCDTKSRDPNGGVPPNPSTPDNEGENPPANCPNGNCEQELKLQVDPVTGALLFILIWVCSTVAG